MFKIMGRIPQASGKKFLRNKKGLCKISGASAALNLPVLTTNKIIQFLPHCLPSKILPISHSASS